MKPFKPATLFYILTVILAVMSLYTFLFEVPDPSQFEFSTVPYLFFLTGISLIESLIYTYLWKHKKPMSNTLSYIHFVITIVAFYWSFEVYKFVRLFFWSSNDEFLSLDMNDEGAWFLLYIGPILLILSLVAFVMNILRAFRVGKRG